MVERFGVTRVVGLGSVPMAVPHTRPIAITHHANDADLITGESPWRGELRIPSSAQALLEVRLGEWGHAALGFVAHVPHYLAQLDYPQASAALLEQVELGRSAHRRPVRPARRGRGPRGRDRALPRRQRGGREVVAALEQQYDAFERAEESGSSLLAGDQPLPTGEEIGQQFEQFLAGLDGPDDPTATTDPSGTSDDARVADELVALLDLETLDIDLFRGPQPHTDRQRVFGGQVAAQALVAGVRTVDPAYVVHSLHSYFLRPGDTAVPIIYDVEELRDGRSFGTRRVVGPPARPPDLLPDRQLPARTRRASSTRTPMPDVPARAGRRPGRPDARRGGAERRRCAGQGVGRASTCAYLGTLTDGPARGPRPPVAGADVDPGQRRLSATTRSEHLAAFTYASDMSLLGATLAPHGVTRPPAMQMASLDHTIWFHRPFRADQWWLYDQESPSASGGRGLALGRVFTEDGRLVATVAQEG